MTLSHPSMVVGLSDKPKQAVSICDAELVGVVRGTPGGEMGKMNIS
jgi:hypothetical protein